ncbi:methylated-DNA--[protein]-cysteine S-methyltransferase [Aliiglaciecola sp. M165]|uniref:methylated-DNA--[protein]-cysteine S-methyltransferase n=1 Tax=Aliiglaciecola sp. M165 TaxID=2593649 RepID=UPI00117D6A46|nr:methylated-DNA--[protein]-cysteine S-methyltransferase [Aliiglaciecola sp. M165]
MASIVCETFLSPLGELVLGDFQGRLVMCDWSCRSNRILIYNRLCRKYSASFRKGKSPLLEEAIYQIEEYFSGCRTAFTVPFTLDGTYFQSEVWHQVRRIPFGQRSTYSKISRRLNVFDSKEKIKRALAACPISIIIPTHRAICEDHKINDFAGFERTSILLRNLESPLVNRRAMYASKALEQACSS